MIIVRFASTNFTIPIVTEANLIELFTIAINIFFSSHSRMLSGLYSILFSRKAVRVITHRMKHVKTLLAFKTAVYIRGDVSQRVTNMQTSA